jgi:hypothetical protein
MSFASWQSRCRPPRRRLICPRRCRPAERNGGLGRCNVSPLSPSQQHAPAREPSSAAPVTGASPELASKEVMEASTSSCAVCMSQFLPAERLGQATKVASRAVQCGPNGLRAGERWPKIPRAYSCSGSPRGCDHPCHAAHPPGCARLRLHVVSGDTAGATQIL